MSSPTTFMIFILKAVCNRSASLMSFALEVAADVPVLLLTFTRLGLVACFL